jgi:hypothetical protein
MFDKTKQSNKQDQFDFMHGTVDTAQNNQKGGPFANTLLNQNMTEDTSAQIAARLINSSV